MADLREEIEREIELAEGWSGTRSQRLALADRIFRMASYQIRAASTRAWPHTVHTVIPLQAVGNSSGHVIYSFKG